MVGWGLAGPFPIRRRPDIPPRPREQLVLPPVPVGVVAAPTSVAIEVHAREEVECVVVRFVFAAGPAQPLILDAGYAIVGTEGGHDRPALAIRLDLPRRRVPR